MAEEIKEELGPISWHHSKPPMVEQEEEEHSILPPPTQADINRENANHRTDEEE